MTAAPARSGRAAPGTAELAAEREFLLRSIRDLDAEWAAGEISDDDYRQLRDSYTARAAEVLRRQPRADAAAPGVRTVAPPPRARTLGVRTLAWVAVVLAGATGAGLAVSAASGERLPGREATGSLPGDEDVDRITRAQLLVQQGQILEAVKLYDDVLADDPDNPVALAHRGWLISRAGLVDEGLASIDRALAADPSYAEARFFRGMVLWRAKSDPAGAAEEFRVLLESRPPPALVPVVEDARRAALADAGAPADQESGAIPGRP